jgi:hypothetical protein
MPGDINADGTVDIFDLVVIALHYNGNIPPSTPWPLPPEDINGDNIIDLFDLVIVALHFVKKPSNQLLNLNYLLLYPGSKFHFNDALRRVWIILRSFILTPIHLI